MKSKLLMLILIVFLIPISVLAKDSCNSNDISISDVKLYNASGNTYVREEADFTNNSIDVSAAVNKVGDYIQYRVVISNDSNENYIINKNSVINSKYIGYKIFFPDGSDVVPAKSSKTIYLRVSYDRPAPSSEFENGLLSLDDNFTFKLQTKTNILTNPATYFNLVLVIVLFGLVIASIFASRTYKLRLILLFTSLSIIPMFVYAVCSFDIKVNSNIVVSACDGALMTNIGSFDDNGDVPYTCVNVVRKNYDAYLAFPYEDPNGRYISMFLFTSAAHNEDFSFRLYNNGNLMYEFNKDNLPYSLYPLSEEDRYFDPYSLIFSSPKFEVHDGDNWTTDCSNCNDSSSKVKLIRFNTLDKNVSIKSWVDLDGYENIYNLKNSLRTITPADDFQCSSNSSVEKRKQLSLANKNLMASLLLSNQVTKSYKFLGFTNCHIYEDGRHNDCSGNTYYAKIVVNCNNGNHDLV
ncbi:MAG: hypothetical protein IJI43_03055 [Bacilli bacterium]|nr:hypothetical protein [Bacilli bacterium]